MTLMHKMFTGTRKIEHAVPDSCYTPALNVKQRTGARIRARHAERNSRCARPGLQRATEWSRSRP
jgi:hypothetical protein